MMLLKSPGPEFTAIAMEFMIPKAGCFVYSQRRLFYGLKGFGMRSKLRAQSD